MPTWKADVLLTGDWRGASCVLLTGSQLVLVDTGMPHDACHLIEALAKRGLQPADVRCLINTHFHFDHVSNNFLFPNSVIYASQQSHNWCIGLYRDLGDANWRKLILRYYPETLEYDNAEELMGKLRKLALRWWDMKRIGASSQFRWIETHTLPEGLEGFVTGGHVPGHVSLLVKATKGTTVVAGDAVLTQNQEDRVLTMIPHCRAQYRDERQRILSIPGFIIPGHGQAFENPAA